MDNTNQKNLSSVSNKMNFDNQQIYQTANKNSPIAITLCGLRMIYAQIIAFLEILPVNLNKTRKNKHDNIIKCEDIKEEKPREVFICVTKQGCIVLHRREN